MLLTYTIIKMKRLTLITVIYNYRFAIKLKQNSVECRDHPSNKAFAKLRTSICKANYQNHSTS